MVKADLHVLSHLLGGHALVAALDHRIIATTHLAMVIGHVLRSLLLAFGEPDPERGIFDDLPNHGHAKSK